MFVFKYRGSEYKSQSASHTSIKKNNKQSSPSLSAYHVDLWGVCFPSLGVEDKFQAGIWRYIRYEVLGGKRREDAVAVGSWAGAEGYRGNLSSDGQTSWSVASLCIEEPLVRWSS